MPYGGEYHGHEGVVEHGLGYLGTWDPVQRAGDEVLEPAFLDGGDRVFVRWRQKATAANGEHVDEAIRRFLECAAAGSSSSPN